MEEEKEVSGKKTKVVLILSSVVLVIIIAIVLIIMLKKPEVEKACERCFSQSYDEIRNLTKLAVESDNRSICEQILDDGAKDNCDRYFKDYYLEEAIPKLCEDPKDKYDEVECQFISAILSNNFEMCKPPKKDTSTDELCVIITAVQLNDETVCDLMENNDKNQRP